MLVRQSVMLIALALSLPRAAAPQASQQLGSTAPNRPEVFAPGVISTGNVFRGSFPPDGSAFYFFKKVTEGQEDYRIFVSARVGHRWSEPERVELGGEYSDLYPSISPDGRRMVFSSYRPAPGDTSSEPNANLWYVDREGDEWGEPVFMAAASTLANYDAGPEFGPDGAIYFGSTTPDWTTKRHLITRWNGTVYGEPVPFEGVERWVGWRSDLHLWGGKLGPDGSFILLGFSKIDLDTGRRQPSDYWVTFKEDGDWTAPRPLGAGVNTEATENFATFTPDGQELLFVRDFESFYRVSLQEALW